MHLKKELEKLNGLIGRDDAAFNKQLNAVKKLVKTEADKKMLSAYLDKIYKAGIEESQKAQKEITLKMQLEEVYRMVSLSYIAKHYFNKSSQWLYARINANIVNGKPVSLTPKQVETLNFAIKDIGKKLSSINVSL